MCKQIYTIGYEGATVEEVLACLLDNGIQEVLDIRELPLSRKKGFSKTCLRELLEERGIGYQHLRALGCPRDVRNRYRETGDWEHYTEELSRYLDGQVAAVEQVRDLCGEESLALLCFERDALHCHRSLVAERVKALADGEIEIVHLLAE